MWEGAGFHASVYPKRYILTFNNTIRIIVIPQMAEIQIMRAGKRPHLVRLFGHGDDHGLVVVVDGLYF